MDYQCTTCDIRSTVYNDPRFYACKQNGHHIATMLPASDIKKHLKEKLDKNTSNKIYDFIKTKIKKCVVSDNDSSQVFIIIENNDHLETLDLSNGKARDWLRYVYYKETSENNSDDFYKIIISLIRSEAMYDGTVREKIYNRIAMTDNTIYYDLTTHDWKFLKITKDAVEVIDYNTTMPIFVRKQQQKEQVKPLSDSRDSLEELVRLLRIQDRDKQVFKVHLLAMHLEAYPVPLMVILGEHGSIKTTIAKSVKRIVDPSGENISSLPSKMEDLILHFANRYLINFDNISNINDEVSDALCRAITGEGQSKRKLYSDSDEIIFHYRRKCILNGIFPPLDRTDLRDRMIRYETLPVKETERISENEFDMRLTELLPHVVGQISQCLQKTLAIHESVKDEIKNHPRMADFTIYGECISRTLNYKPLSFVNEYKLKLDENTLDVAESYPIIQLIEIIMKDKTIYEKTVSEFYREICNLAEMEGIEIDSKKRIRFPASSNKIKPHIERINPNLRLLGYDIHIQPYQKRDCKHPRGSHIISISRPTLDPPKGSLSSTSSLS